MHPCILLSILCLHAAKEIADGDYKIGHTTKKDYFLMTSDGIFKMKKAESPDDGLTLTISKERNMFLFVVNDKYIVRRGMGVFLSAEKTKDAYWEIEGMPEYSKLRNGELCLDYGLFEDGEYNVYMGFCNKNNANQNWRLSLVSLGIDSQLDLLIKRDLMLARREEENANSNRGGKDYNRSLNSLFARYGNPMGEEQKIIELPH